MGGLKGDLKIGADVVLYSQQELVVALTEDMGDSRPAADWEALGDGRECIAMAGCENRASGNRSR